MDCFTILLGFTGFGAGFSAGLMIGYFLFIYFLPTDVKDPVIRPLVEQDSGTLQRLLPEIPLWVKIQTMNVYVFSGSFHFLNLLVFPRSFKIDWLTRFLEYMWPYLDKAICKTAKDIAKPIIEEQIPKYNIKSVEIESLNFGSFPPTFQGMKVYDTKEKELIMEPSFKWAGNPNVIVAAKSFGLKATVQVVDLQMFAVPRITLKPLVPSCPCFANIYISLMDKPHVDFGLKLLGLILCQFLELVKDKAADMYLWPKMPDVPIMDPEKALKKPVGILYVKVLRAMNLKRKDIMGSSDPYVKLKLTEDKFQSKKTTVKHNDLNPEWNEEFKMVVRDPETQALEISVYDWEQVGKHDKIGMNMVPLKELPPNEPKVMTLDLLENMDSNDVQNDKSGGQLMVELTFKPFKEEDMEKILMIRIRWKRLQKDTWQWRPACGYSS